MAETPTDTQKSAAIERWASGADTQNSEEIDKQKEDVSRAAFDVERVLALLDSNSDMAGKLKNALESARSSVGSTAGQFGSALASVKALAAEAARAINETEKVKDTQRYYDYGGPSASASLRGQYLAAKQMRGFHDLDEKLFLKVSQLFEDMDLIDRAMITKTAERDPELAKSIETLEVAGEELVKKAEHLRSTYREKLVQATTALPDSDTAKAGLQALGEELRYAAITPTNMEEWQKHLDDFGTGKISSQQLLTYMEEAVKPQRAKLSEKLVQAFELDQAYMGMGKEQGQALIKQHFGDVTTLAANDPTKLTGEMREEAYKILLAARARHNATLPEGEKLSVGEYRALLMQKPEMFEALSDKEKAGVMLHTVITNGRLTQRITHLSQIIQDTPGLYEELKANISKNPDFVFDKLHGFGVLENTTPEHQQILQEVFRNAKPEQRDALLEAMKGGNIEGVKGVWHNITSTIQDVELMNRYNFMMFESEISSGKAISGPAQSLSQIPTNNSLIPNTTTLNNEPALVSPITAPSAQSTIIPMQNGGQPLILGANGNANNFMQSAVPNNEPKFDEKIQEQLAGLDLSAIKDAQGNTVIAKDANGKVDMAKVSEVLKEKGITLKDVDKDASGDITGQELLTALAKQKQTGEQKAIS